MQTDGCNATESWTPNHLLSLRVAGKLYRCIYICLGSLGGDNVCVCVLSDG